MHRIVLILVLGLVHDLPAQDDYQPGPDSLVQPNVPKGELIKGSYTAEHGSVFPGTERDYTIYLPAGFSKDKPAPFMVFQDGVIYSAPVVFDNLIAKKEMPPIIGIFIKPGVVPAANPNALPRDNRSYEYDSVTDTYARFLIDEFLPAIQKKHDLALSTDPNDAAIAGNSSGGICAFMAAWHRPDRIRRVFTGVGTYVGIRGGDQLPVLVRKYEPKPLRVYLQSGEHDNNIYCGDWWMANQMMERSLTWAGYDVNHAWGTGGHNQKHATQIFPDVLRWLWRDYATAKEIKVNPRGESKWRGYEVIGDWKWESAVGHEPDPSGMHLTSKATGEVVTWHIPSGPGCENYYTIKSDGSAHKSSMDFGIGTICFGKNDLVYLFGLGDERMGDSFLMRVGSQFQRKADTFDRRYAACVDYTGRVYYLYKGGIVVEKDGKELDILDWYRFGRTYPIAFTLSPDQTMLFAIYDQMQYVQSIQVSPDGRLSYEQRFGVLQLNAEGEVSPRSLCVDTDGRVYVSTNLGVQVLDQAGRVNFIIPTPQPPHDICFGGKDLSELFIACGDKIYKRSTKAHGIVSGQMAPIKPVPRKP